MVCHTIIYGFFKTVRKLQITLVPIECPSHTPPANPIYILPICRAMLAVVPTLPFPNKIFWLN